MSNSEHSTATKIHWTRVMILGEDSEGDGFMDTETLDFSEPVTLREIDRDFQVRVLREYRETGAIYDYWLGRLPGQDGDDASTWGPTVDQIDWSGFPEEPLADRIDRDRLAEMLHHLMDGYDEGERWSLYVDPITARLSVEPITGYRHQAGLVQVISDGSLHEWCQAGVPATVEEWREIVEDFIGDTGVFDQIETMLAEEAVEDARRKAQG